jgi:hypothetical protein
LLNRSSPIATVFMKSDGIREEDYPSGQHQTSGKLKIKIKDKNKKAEELKRSEKQRKKGLEAITKVLLKLQFMRK